METVTGFEKFLEEAGNYWQLQHNVVTSREGVRKSCYACKFCWRLSELSQCPGAALLDPTSPSDGDAVCVPCPVVGTSHMCLLSTWYMGSAIEELKFCFYFSLINSCLHLNSHICYWLVSWTMQFEGQTCALTARIPGSSYLHPTSWKIWRAWACVAQSSPQHFQSHQ